MKFLKKLALANITSLGTISHYHYHSPDFTYTDTYLSCCLRNFEKLIHRLNKYLLIRKRNNSQKLEFNDLSKKIINAHLVSYKSYHVTDWAPLIKSTSPIKNINTDSKNQINDRGNYCLADQSVLCVGGRIKLYPVYSQLIANSGGNLTTFHGDPNDHLGNLSQLLENTDMVICPIDCVNHQAFFMVKYYCKYSGKPCVLLDRSEVNTFCRGIDMLTIMITK